MSRTIVKSKETVVSARVSPAVRKKLDKMAEGAGVTRGEYAARVLADHVEHSTTLAQDIGKLRKDMAELARMIAAGKSQRGETEGAPLTYLAGVEATGADIADAIEKGSRS